MYRKTRLRQWANALRDAKRHDAPGTTGFIAGELYISMSDGLARQLERELRELSDG